MSNTDTRTNLSKLMDVVTLDNGVHAYTGYTVEYTDYSATVTRSGRTYPVATVTEYPDGHVYITRHHTMNATTLKAWRAMHESLGFPVDYHRPRCRIARAPVTRTDSPSA